MAIPFDSRDPAPAPAATTLAHHGAEPGRTPVSETSRESVEARFDRILRDHGPALSRLASGYERVPAAREELMQEIALAIWQALPRFRGECSERTFAFRIAHNRGITHATRRRPAHESLDALTDAEAPRDTAPQPDEHAALVRRRDALRTAIRTLSPLHREIVMLALEDLGTVEIAEVLGISENNAGVRLHRARAALRKALEERS